MAKRMCVKFGKKQKISVVTSSFKYKKVKVLG